MPVVTTNSFDGKDTTDQMSLNSDFVSPSPVISYQNLDAFTPLPLSANVIATFKTTWPTGHLVSPIGTIQES